MRDVCKVELPVVASQWIVGFIGLTSFIFKVSVEIFLLIPTCWPNCGPRDIWPVHVNDGVPLPVIITAQVKVSDSPATTSGFSGVI